MGNSASLPNDLGTIQRNDLTKLLVVTLGDPYSINVESVLGALSTLTVPCSLPVVMVGSYWQWNLQLDALLSMSSFSLSDSFSRLLADIKLVRRWNEVGPDGFYFLDVCPSRLAADSLSMEERGYIACSSLQALEPLMDGVKSYDVKLAVVTCPINKKACEMAGFTYPGQTEYFGDLWGTDPIMVLAGPKLKVGLATNHMALNDIPEAISEDLIVNKARLLVETLSEVYDIPKPKIAICGLNPHCGDHGLFGTEDTDIIEPAVKMLRSLGFDAHGPFPADTIFFQGYCGEWDGILAMYHDQGLGPLKTVHFYDAVNMSGGMPYFRVSPDHGPASELYLKGKARYDSVILSFRHAFRFLSGAACESLQ